MADITFPWRSATVCAMRSETTAAIISNWSWNSSTLSFIDFISEKLGPVYYNAGIEEAIRIWPGASASRKRWI